MLTLQSGSLFLGTSRGPIIQGVGTFKVDGFEGLLKAMHVNENI